MPAEIEQLLAPYPTKIELPVQWGDMDSAQHVNNIVYLRWAESGRIDYFRHVDLLDFSGEKVGAILGAVQCKYIFPLTYPDRVWVATKSKEIRSDRFILETAIISQQHQRLAALVLAEIVPYDYVALQKAGMPQDLRETIEQFEAPFNG